MPDESVTCNKRVNVHNFMIDKLSFKVCNFGSFLYCLRKEILIFDFYIGNVSKLYTGCKYVTYYRVLLQLAVERNYRSTRHVSNTTVPRGAASRTSNMLYNA